MKKTTIRNIILAILGAFSFGLGQDINKYSIETTGFILVFIAMCLAIAEAFRE